MQTTGLASANPIVTVLMSVHNGARYVRQAVDSVLAQDVDAFEFLIIDDGSTDTTPDILKAYRDSRIRIEFNGVNIGLTPSLNKGLCLARGQYIARLDADDICEPNRLSRQMAFLDRHPDHVICGSSYTLIDEEGVPLRRKIKDFNDIGVRWISQFRTPIDHSTAMFRAKVVHQDGLFYDEAYRTAQDYDYWLRLLALGKGCVLAETLMRYRMHDANITRSLKPSQRQNLYTIATTNFERNWPELRLHTDGFANLVRMYYLEEQATPRAIRLSVGALSALVRAFSDRFELRGPERAWVRRQASGMLAEAVIGKGKAARRPAALMEFVRRAWPTFPALTARVAEEWRTARLA